MVRDAKVTCSGRISDTRDMLRARDWVQSILLQELAPFWFLTGAGAEKVSDASTPGEPNG